MTSSVKPDWVDINIGAPQGSILGPILFFLNINEFGNIPATSFVIHADDISLLVSDSSDESLEPKTNSLLGSVLGMDLIIFILTQLKHKQLDYIISKRIISINYEQERRTSLIL